MIALLLLFFSSHIFANIETLTNELLPLQKQLTILQDQLLNLTASTAPISKTDCSKSENIKKPECKIPEKIDGKNIILPLNNENFSDNNKKLIISIENYLSKQQANLYSFNYLNKLMMLEALILLFF